MTDDLAEADDGQLVGGASPVDPDQVRVLAQFVRQEIQQEIRQEFHEHFSDLPDADQLVKLEQAQPGTITRMLDHMDREQGHRHVMNQRAGDYDDRRLDKSIELRDRAQKLMAAIALLAIGGGIASTLTGHSGAGLATVISALATLALAFVWGRSGRQRPPEAA